MPENRILIGIDDTDTKNSKGTGFISRELARQIESNNLGKVINITRHQLFISDKIQYTNRNNSACIELVSNQKEELISFCHKMILSSTLNECGPVLVFADLKSVSKEIIEFGFKAKKTLVSFSEASILIENSKLIVDVVRESKNGMIGALAAIGLRASGNDGRVVWVKGHEIKDLAGTYMVGEVYCKTNVDIIKTTSGYKVPISASLNFENNRIKPVLIDNAITYLVEEVNEGALNKEIIGSTFKASLN